MRQPTILVILLILPVFWCAQASGQERSAPIASHGDAAQTEMPPSHPFIRGDADSDGVISISDAVLIMEVLFAYRHADCLDALDANDDGVVDLTDVIDLIFFLSYPETGLPPPFTASGRDPTQDALTCHQP